MNKLQIEIAKHLEAVEKTAALMRGVITKDCILPEDWLTIGKYMGHIGKGTTEAAFLVAELVGIASEEVDRLIINKLQNNGTAR